MKWRKWNIMNDTGVLVVTYNQYEITRKFILNFKSTFSDEKYYLLILDNNSKDMTYEKVKSEFPEIDIRKLNDNYGCVTGRNIGIVELVNKNCKYIYITDNDIVFEDSGMLSKLKEFMNRNIGLDGCCPVVRWEEDKTIQTLGVRMLSRNRFKYISDFDENNSVNILPGCAQFLCSDSFKKYGLFDNDFSPFGIEDLEWGIRAFRLNAKFEYCREAEVLHLHRKNLVISRNTIKQMIRGRVIFLRKYFSLFNLLKELHFLSGVLFKYNTFFLIGAYINGMKAKITKKNYLYDDFKMTVSNYYSKA
jgi:GT2 family glycosyltransferase